jgi:hypothetical protein
MLKSPKKEQDDITDKISNILDNKTHEFVLKKLIHVF